MVYSTVEIERCGGPGKLRSKRTVFSGHADRQASPETVEVVNDAAVLYWNEHWGSPGGPQLNGTRCFFQWREYEFTHNLENTVWALNVFSL